MVNGIDLVDIVANAILGDEGDEDTMSLDKLGKRDQDYWREVARVAARTTLENIPKPTESMSMEAQIQVTLRELDGGDINEMSG